MKQRAILLSPLVLAMAAGCSGASGTAGGSTSTAPGHHVSKASADPKGRRIRIPTSGSYKVSTPPGSSKGYVGAAQDVKVSTCESRKGATTFSGTVTNPTDVAQSYRIYVAVTFKDATIGVDEIDVRILPARARANWDGSLASGTAGASCVLRVERTRRA